VLVTHKITAQTRRNFGLARRINVRPMTPREAAVAVKEVHPLNQAPFTAFFGSDEPRTERGQLARVLRNGEDHRKSARILSRAGGPPALLFTEGS